MSTTIGLDLGTGAIKGVCWNASKGILKTISERVAFNRPAPKYEELEPAAYAAQVIRIIQQLADAADEPVDGIAFAAASGNTLLCTQDAKPLTPIISWLDTRLDWRPPADWDVRQVCGWPPIPSFPLMHLEYFRQTAPELLKTSVVAMNNDWLCWLLCGRHALDYSNGAPFYLFNQAEKRYHKPFLDYYGISEAQLPEMLPPGTVIGKLKHEFANGKLTTDTAIVAGSFDHPAGARAAGITKPGSMLLSCGTSWVGFYPVDNRQDIVDRKELCDSFQSHNGGCWGAMFSVAGIGIDIETFVCDTYGKDANRYEAFNYDALKPGTAARQKMTDVVKRFKARLDGHPVTGLTVSGGPSEGAAWPVVMADVLQLPITISPYKSYTGAVGAAMLALAHVC